jgi:type II secretory pathway component PulF
LNVHLIERTVAAFAVVVVVIFVVVVALLPQPNNIVRELYTAMKTWIQKRCFCLEYYIILFCFVFAILLGFFPCQMEHEKSKNRSRTSE